MDEDIQDIIQRLKVIIENRGNKPLDVLGGYIVGTTLVRDDWEEKYQSQYPLLDELAELGADLEVTKDPQHARELFTQIANIFERLCDSSPHFSKML